MAGAVEDEHVGGGPGDLPEGIRGRLDGQRVLPIRRIILHHTVTPEDCSWRQLSEHRAGPGSTSPRGTPTPTTSTPRPARRPSSPTTSWSTGRAGTRTARPRPALPAGRRDRLARRELAGQLRVRRLLLRGGLPHRGPHRGPAAGDRRDRPGVRPPGGGPAPGAAAPRGGPGGHGLPGARRRGPRPADRAAQRATPRRQTRRSPPPTPSPQPRPAPPAGALAPGAAARGRGRRLRRAGPLRPRHGPHRRLAGRARGAGGSGAGPWAGSRTSRGCPGPAARPSSTAWPCGPRSRRALARAGPPSAGAADAVAPVLFGERAPFAPGTALTDAWLAELGGGRFRGRPLGGEQDVRGCPGPAARPSRAESRCGPQTPPSPGWPPPPATRSSRVAGRARPLRTRSAP